MATFIPGMTDVFPSSGAFNLDFNRIERMLKLRESMYQQGAKKVKSLYDSIFSSTMLRDDNIEKRDAYLKTITDSLNSVSALDFSLPQNQQIATSLFDPIVTDKTIVKDIAFTKNYLAEVSKAESLRTSTDKATRKQYWDVGRRALDYMAEEFKNADPTTALGMSAPKYVSKVDIQELADKMYKDAGISVKEDTIKGGYIWTQKNGDLVFPVTQNYVKTLFSQDPAIKEMLRIQAYVERKDYINQNAAAMGGADKAEIAYVTNIIRKLGTDVQEDLKTIQASQIKYEAKVNAWNEIIKKRGIVPSENNPEYVEYLQDLNSLEKTKKTVEQLKQELSSLQDIRYDNPEDMRLAADQYVTMSNYTLLVNNIAKNLAFKNAEVTAKPDPISLAKLRADLQIRNQKEIETIRTRNRKEEIRLRDSLRDDEDEDNRGKKKNKTVELNNLYEFDDEDDEDSGFDDGEIIIPTNTPKSDKNKQYQPDPEIRGRG